MRHNKFGEAYCQSAAEAHTYVANHSDGAVHVSEIDPPGAVLGTATAEVRENESGETVCWIEASTVDEVRAIIIGAGIEIVL